MKKVLVVLFSLMITLSFAQVVNQTDAQGRKQGTWKKTYPKTSIVHYVGQFKDDKPVGTFTYYYQSSKVQAIIKHDANSTRSYAVFYHENGNKMSEGVYRSMKKDSIWCNYVPSGRLSSKEAYKNDLLDGIKTVYYISEVVSDVSLQIMSTTTYRAGKLDGEHLEYFLAGGLKQKGTYKANVKVGKWENYSTSGKIEWIEQYTDGERDGWWIVYDEQGHEKHRNYYDHGVLLEGKKLEEKIKQLRENAAKPKN